MMAIAENTPPPTFEWWSFGSSKLESPRLRREDSAIATSNDWYSVLKYEFSAEEGSFLLQLRCDFVWDRAAFSRLTEAMLACCKVYDAGIGGSHDWQSDDGSPANKECLPRWLADGFWYLAMFVKGHTTHPAWHERTALDQDYYDRAYERLEMLAEWFFNGHCPYRDPDVGFVPM